MGRSVCCSWMIMVIFIQSLVEWFGFIIYLHSKPERSFCQTLCLLFPILSHGKYLQVLFIHAYFFLPKFKSQCWLSFRKSSFSTLIDEDFCGINKFLYIYNGASTYFGCPGWRAAERKKQKKNKIVDDRLNVDQTCHGLLKGQIWWFEIIHFEARVYIIDSSLIPHPCTLYDSPTPEPFDSPLNIFLPLSPYSFLVLKYRFGILDVCWIYIS